ncbi:MAG: hypothetical protein WCI54_08670 [Bacteroidia bacterium]|jgi:hypothetical protein
MSKLSTLNYLVNSYYAGKKEVRILQMKGIAAGNFETDTDQIEFEPSQSSINAILSFASQCGVIKSINNGNIELNLN